MDLILIKYGPCTEFTSIYMTIASVETFNGNFKYITSNYNPF